MTYQNPNVSSMTLHDFALHVSPVANRTLKTPLPQRYENEQYFGAKIPMRWMKRLGQLPGKSVLLGFLLWHWAVMDKRGNETRVRPLAARTAGLPRNTMYRALDKLEAAGLITVIRQRGRSARVEILDVPRS